MGTPAYMSPEQVRAEKADQRTDIWSVGVVLYEMLTGRTPFRGESPQSVSLAIQSSNPEPVTALRAGVPQRLEWVVGKALAKNVEERYQHMGEMLVDLRSVCKQLESTGVPSGSTRPAMATDAAGDPPVVVLMDTSASEGVYDLGTRCNSGTNADDLNSILRDLPLLIQQEVVSATWDREDQVLKQRPDLLLIHRACFAYSMKLEHCAWKQSPPRRRWLLRLHELAENKLVALLGHFGLGSPRTKVLVYSRGWSVEAERREWVADVEKRFPTLAGRIFTMNVGDQASFRDRDTSRLVKAQVQSLLNLEAVTPKKVC